MSSDRSTDLTAALRGVRRRGLSPAAFVPFVLIRHVIARCRRHRMPGSVAIPDGGVIVRATDVRRHRYLAARGLPHSPSVASVFLGFGK